MEDSMQALQEMGSACRTMAETCRSMGSSCRHMAESCHHMSLAKLKEGDRYDELRIDIQKKLADSRQESVADGDRS